MRHYNDASEVMVELTEDGLFMAYVPGYATSYALGETAEEARENLLDRYEFSAADYWADPDEACYLRCALG